jgi:lysophospholipase L1-like esterase
MAETDTAPPTPAPRFKYTLLKLVYVVVVVIVGLAVLEGAARYMGLGDPVLFYNDAWGGVRPLPNQRVSRIGGATVTIDANGFRTPVPDQPGALRVLYLGDSVTWGGSTTDDAQLFSEVAADVLRAKDHPVYAMNSGVNATALINHAERFQDYDGKLDALVWLFPWGDTNRSYTVVGDMWPAARKPRFALVEVIDYVIVHYWKMLSRRPPSSQGDFKTPEGPSAGKPFVDAMFAKRKVRNLEAVRSVVAEAKRRGVPVILGVTPYRTGNKLDPLPPDAVAFLKEMADAGVTIFDVSAVISNSGIDPQDLYIDSPHFSVKGHRLVGEALGKKLETVIKTDEQ